MISAIRCSTSSGVSRPAGAVALVVLPHHAEAVVERRLVGLHDRHRDADVGEVHGDAATHRARRRSRRPARPSRVGVSAGDVGDLRRLALGEEVVALGARTAAPLSSSTKSSRSCCDALVERQVDGGLDALDVVLGGAEAAGLAGDRLPELREQLGLAPGGRAPCRRGRGSSGAAVPRRPARSAKATAPAMRSPSTSSSTSPSRRASSPPIGSPLTIISSAFSTPTTRGSRWVPPAPGRRPSFTSGSPQPRRLHADAVVAAPAPPRARRRARCRGSPRPPASGSPR